MNLDAGKFHSSGEREKQKIQVTNARCRGGRGSCGVSVVPAGPEQRERLPACPSGGSTERTASASWPGGPCSRNSVGLTFEDQPVGF